MDESARFITTKTPLRITFAGGGTDIPAYSNEYNGAVVSATINKYIYVTVARNFYNDEIRLSYSKTENALKNIDDIKHPSVREAMRMLDIRGGVQIISITEIPSHGTGLGSSSSFLVGLLNALHAWIGEAASQKQLAEEAVHIEREVLKEPGGKQDQYMAAWGGIQLMEFNKDGSVAVKPTLLRAADRKKLNENLLLLYTGKERDSTIIHKNQHNEISSHLDAYEEMKKLAYDTYDSFSLNNYSNIGHILDANWKLKKQLAGGITDPVIDDYYSRAMQNGAEGGKLIGAGGGGFMMFYAKPEFHERIKKALPELQEVDFRLEPFGSRITSIEDNE
jgi:D-glycero-alpha-D-manno-heptose-7-phosphate kinase